MTPLITRMRPLASHAVRLRLPHRPRRAAVRGAMLPATEERLVSGRELAVLRATIVPGSARLP